jgi:hypothetical protein
MKLSVATFERQLRSVSSHRSLSKSLIEKHDAIFAQEHSKPKQKVKTVKLTLDEHPVRLLSPP